MDFNTLLNPDDAAQLVSDEVHPWMQANEAFYNGNHLNLIAKGDGWIGPGPQAGAADHGQFIDTLAPAFISQNCIKRVVDRKINAVGGKPARWGFVPRRALKDDEKPSSEESTLIGRADALALDWWKRRKAHRVMQRFLRNYELFGRAGLRLFIPPGELDEQGNIRKDNLEGSLNKLYLECPSPRNLHVHTDRETMREIGIFMFSENDEVADEKGVKRLELRRKAEVSFIGEGGKTVLRLIQSDKPKEGQPLDLKGNLWHFEATGEPLISESIRSQQKLLNLAKTVERRNLADNGWLEEFLINTQLPGDWEKDAQGNKLPDGKFIPAPIVRGPGVTRDVKGLETGDQNSPGYTSADVKWRPPVDPATSIAVANDAEESIHKEAAQLHALDTGSDQNSGESLKQRRADFETSTDDSASAYNDAGQWLLETALAIACAISSSGEDFSSLRCNFEARINTGPRTAEENREVTERKKEGLLSRETAIGLQGTDDVDSEVNRIEAEKATQDGLNATPVPRAAAPTLQVVTDAA